MDSSSPYGVLLEESCDDEEKRTFEKECEAADALVQISVILVDATQILHDCHKVRCRQIYGQGENYSIDADDDDDDDVQESATAFINASIYTPVHN